MKALHKTAEERGAVTAETAIIMIVVSALLILIIGTGSLVVAHAQLSEGARTVAREVMRGEGEHEAVAAAARVTGPDARFEITRDGEYVKVRASRTIRLPGPLINRDFTIDSEATARLEPHLVGSS